MEDIALRSSQIFYIFPLRVEIATIFEPKVVTISAPNTIISKIGKLCKAISSIHRNIFQPNFGILLPFNGSFREFLFVCLDKKLVYNANLSFVMSMIRNSSVFMF